MRQLVALNTPNKDGVTRRASLESARKQLAKAGKSEHELNVMFAELTPVEIPPGADWVLQTFHQVNSARQQGMNGPQPINFQELRAYAELTGESFSPWELATLRAMDNAYLDEAYKVIGAT